jgi:hypothetical protein
MRARRLRGRVCGATTSAAALCNGLARRLLRLLTLRRRGATLGLRLPLLDAAATFGGRPPLLRGRSLTLRRGSLLLLLQPRSLALPKWFESSPSSIRKWGIKLRVAVRTRPIYVSPNGDRSLLAVDPDDHSNIGDTAS